MTLAPAGGAPWLARGSLPPLEAISVRCMAASSVSSPPSSSISTERMGEFVLRGACFRCVTPGAPFPGLGLSAARDGCGCSTVDGTRSHSSEVEAGVVCDADVASIAARLRVGRTREAPTTQRRPPSEPERERVGGISGECVPLRLAAWPSLAALVDFLTPPPPEARLPDFRRGASGSSVVRERTG